MAKATAKKAKVTKPVKKSKSQFAVKKPFAKSETLGHLAERAELKVKQAAQVIEALAEVVQAHLKKSGPGVYTLPGLLKFKVVRKPATKARKGVNPFTGEPTMFKAKPARNVIKVRPLKKLKDMVD